MIIKYDYIVFSPYFGKLPNNFDLWLHSCSFNKMFKFIVFTDDKINSKIPENVEIVNISFEKFKKRIQKAFDFKIALSNAYKLCDFKPTYGYVFQEYLKNCKYWGYCDIDLIFGNIAKFLPNDDYDKISYLGHLCFYKNTKKINTMFMNNPIGTINYIDILSSEQHFGFDEIGEYGINSIFKKNNLTIYNLSKNVADIDCRREKLYIVRYEKEHFMIEKKEILIIFDNGKIVSYYVKDKKLGEEYAYVHFQKRKMTNEVSNCNKYIITYNKFADYNIINSNYDSLLSNRKIDTKCVKFKLNAIKRRFTRFVAIKKLKKGCRKK